MSDRDRLAADLHGEDPISGGPNAECGCYITADRLIALGWTRPAFRAPADHVEVDAAAWHAAVCENPVGEPRTAHAMTRRLQQMWDGGIDEERLARALRVLVPMLPSDLNGRNAAAAAIAKAYREDTDGG